MLDTESNEPFKFRTRNWVEINDESRGTYTSNDIKLKTTMLRSNLCDYADAYILVKGTIAITGAGNDDAAKQADEKDKAKLYVPVVTLSTQDNARLLQQLKSGFKGIINLNKYESNIKTFAQNRYLNHLINPSFQGENRLFVLSFENEDDRTSQSTYYLPEVERKDYNVMIDGKNFFDQPINSITKTYENVRKITTGQGDDYTSECLLDYSYFTDHYKIITIDLSKPQALDADAKSNSTN